MLLLENLKFNFIENGNKTAKGDTGLEFCKVNFIENGSKTAKGDTGLEKFIQKVFRSRSFIFW